jgi:hypothetical protein
MYHSRKYNGRYRSYHRAPHHQKRSDVTVLFVYLFVLVLASGGLLALIVDWPAVLAFAGG